MVTRRIAKINKLMREELGSILLREIRDPRLEGVVINEVQTSGDTRHAKVFYTVIGGEEQKEQAAEGLAAAAPFVRRHLAQRLSFRFTPELDFRYDETAENAARIMDTLDRIREEGGMGETPSPGKDGKDEKDDRDEKDEKDE